MDCTTWLLVPYNPELASDAAYIADFERQLAEGINALTRDPARARAMGLAGRQRCIDEFSWSAIAKQTVDVYEKAIAAYTSR